MNEAILIELGVVSDETMGPTVDPLKCEQQDDPIGTGDQTFLCRP